jgi:hypothetical protein
MARNSRIGVVTPLRATGPISSNRTVADRRATSSLTTTSPACATDAGGGG